MILISGPCPEPDHRRAKMRLRCVPVALDGVMVAQQALHCCALYAFAAAVDQPDDRESRFAVGVKIFVNDGDDVARSEGVQIDRVFDRDVDGVVFHNVSWRRSRETSNTARLALSKPINGSPSSSTLLVVEPAGCPSNSHH